VICEGIVFPILSATVPGGGNLSYSYQWQDSVSTWSPASGINTNTNSTYSVDTSKFPIVNNEKRYFRRVVFSGPFNTCQSKSVPILLTRFHKIKNNSVQSDQTICSGDVPLVLSGVTASPTGGTGTYTFLWEQSPNGTASWTNAIGTNTTGNYGSPALFDSTWYRRTVYSGVYKSLPVCTNTSPSVAINVQPSIINNSISILGSGPDTIICSGQKPNQIRKIGLPLGGGNGIYAIQWTVSSSSTGSYTDISGATGLTFTEATLPSSAYYKLKVVSGKCNSLSNIVTVNVLPGISGFNIEPDQSICKNQQLSPIGSVTPGPSGGDGTYRYKWQQNVATGGWADISTNGTSSAYSKSSISDPTQYRRYIYSGLRDCCHDTSNIVSIAILPLPAIPYPGPDTVIYSISKIYHMKAREPLVGETGNWDILSNGTGSINDPTSYNTVIQNLSVGNNSFLWTVSKGTCKLKDSVIIELLKNFIPQGFSPNGDAFNNTFVIEGLYLDDNYVDLSIVNGAGTEVFKTSNRDNQTWTNWDGKNSNGIDLPQGTYYYMLKITSKKSNGPVSRLSGFIVVKRY
jgi:gliding motility-associated-like protein